MKVFSHKLSDLPATIDLVGRSDAGGLAQAVGRGFGQTAIAVGSGGSAASAQYFAACRDSLGARPTLYHTPMDLVVKNADLSSIQLWLFSARGENPDIRAALDSALAQGATDIHVVTSNPVSPLVNVPTSGVTGHFLAVADPKDSFLSTHSLVAAVTGLLLASDLVAENAPEPTLAAFRRSVQEKLSSHHRQELASQLASARAGDTILLLHDPLLGAAATALETSLWEAAIAPVQRTDFRNFAHGRHTWVARHAERTILIALTGHLSRSVYGDIRKLLPAKLRTVHLDYGNAGRFAQAVAIIDALAVVEGLGNAVDIDPGKPGAGPFAKDIYEARSLPTLAGRLQPPLRTKLAAARRRDGADLAAVDLVEAHAAARQDLETARFSGLVLDYDGTVVETNRRLEPPSAELAAQLSRLLEQGMTVGFATGRGGSGCRALRGFIPQAFHPQVLVGYYNGGWIRPLSVDIEVVTPEPSPEIEAVLAWLEGQRELFTAPPEKHSGRQVTVYEHELVQPDEFRRRLRAAPFVKSGEISVSSSRHSIDIFPAASSKLNVVEAIRRGLGPIPAILCVGDSGAVWGNDHELLGHAHGVSVGNVCHRAEGCWPLFGPNLSGPAALIRILMALVPDPDGGFRLSLHES